MPHLCLLRTLAVAGSGVAARRGVMVTDITSHLTIDQLIVALQSVIQNLVPSKALQRVKRSLRRKMRKPSDMGVRTYMQHLIRINREELPLLPPFRVSNSLTEDELIDIILYGTPKSWQIEMERQGFDPLTSDTDAVMKFMENIESAESFDSHTNKESKNGSNKNSNKNSGKKRPSSSNSSGSGIYCEIHGKCGHSTGDCRTIQQLKKDGDKPTYSKNKSWKSKDKDYKKKPEQDMAAFVKKAVKREMNALTDDKKDKKRSRKEDVNNFEEDDDISLTKLDFNEFDKNSDDDDESSVNTEVSV